MIKYKIRFFRIKDDGAFFLQSGVETAEILMADTSINKLKAVTEYVHTQAYKKGAYILSNGKAINFNSVDYIEIILQ